MALKRIHLDGEVCLVSDGGCVPITVNNLKNIIEEDAEAATIDLCKLLPELEYKRLILEALMQDKLIWSPQNIMCITIFFPEPELRSILGPFVVSKLSRRNVDSLSPLERQAEALALGYFVDRFPDQKEELCTLLPGIEPDARGAMITVEDLLNGTPPKCWSDAEADKESSSSLSVRP